MRYQFEFVQANRAFRQVNDARIIQGAFRNKSTKIPDQGFSYGRANRPQTPVEGIIRNNFGEESVCHLQNKYAAWKQMQSSTRGLTGIRMTNAQIAADNAIRAKLDVSKPGALPKAEFKLKRFQNVEPKTSTKRTGGGYASKNPVHMSQEAAFRQQE